MASSGGTKGAGDRESREAAALRANLARRKDQKRARRGVGPVGSAAAEGQQADPEQELSEGDGRS